MVLVTTRQVFFYPSIPLYHYCCNFLYITNKPESTPQPCRPITKKAKKYNKKIVSDASHYQTLNWDVISLQKMPWVNQSSCWGHDVKVRQARTTISQVQSGLHVFIPSRSTDYQRKTLEVAEKIWAVQEACVCLFPGKEKPQPKQGKKKEENFPLCLLNCPASHTRAGASNTHSIGHGKE